MGGGDLNTKKSWHPNTFKNQERVWKAEQADAAEKRKLAELQHEINEERNREELKTIAKKSGLLGNDDGDRKLEWMYKGPQVNREEYLLGRAVDRNFEQLDAQEKATASSSSNLGISQPKNHVEHECIPFSIRAYKGLEGSEQVDMARKLMEDPLMAIKQKEVENRQKILENPVKLKELHRLLKSDRSIKDKKDKKDKKKEKKVKKKKTKKKRRGSDSSSESDSDDDGGKDLDKILAEKYKKVQSTMGEKQDDMGLDKLLSMKYQKLSKELNKMAKPKKSKSKKDKGSSASEDSAQDLDSDDERMQKRRNHHRPSDRAGPSKPRERSRSIDRRERRHRDRSRSLEYRRNARKYSRSPDNRKRERSPDNRKRDRNRSGSADNRKRDSSRSRDRKRSPKSKPERPRGRRTPVPSSSSESSPERKPRQRRDEASDDERNDRPKPKQFGLVTAGGQKLELNKRDEVRLYKREEIKAQQSSQKPTWSRPERKAALTEEEMDAKRKAMMSNAEWRDKERERNVRRYDDEDRKQEQRDKEKEYDKEFLTKQFKHAAGYETVEKRIKSNRNNIQRAGGAMNDNFAKR